MGHIANKIDAKDKKLSEVLTGQRYRIDSFQREYRWQRKHIESLISDLVISFKKNYEPTHTIKNCDNYDCYYMGPIVLCDTRNELSIVDGQQRLSSFTLLFIYLLHQQNLITNTNIVLRDLKPFLYVTKAGETSFVLNVKSRNKVLEHLITNPDKTYSEIQELEENMEIDPEEQEIRNFEDESIRNLIERYEDVTKLFPNDIKEPEVLPLFIEWLLEKVVIVEVKAYSMENAYTIFETMNDRGMTLNPTEILKAFLLNKIDNDGKSEEVNEFWKKRISDLKSEIGDDTDLDFFRAWLRAKYAESKRESKQGAENEDFELIGTQFHAWVKNNQKKVNLSNSDDYYFFIRSDFDFFSNLYISLYEYKNNLTEDFKTLYISNFFPIADSLSYPLLLAPVTKIDDEIAVTKKIQLVSKFLDIYTLERLIQRKTVTQSSIRYYIYDLVKSIRNMNIDDLYNNLSSEVVKISSHPFSSFSVLHSMDNWGFYHYLFARLLYVNEQKTDFSDLLRSRRRNSYILVRIFEFDDIPNDIELPTWHLYTTSVAGHCLIRRDDYDNVFSKKGYNRIKYIFKKGYMPEIEEINTLESKNVLGFISFRDDILRKHVESLLNFNN